MAICGHCGAEIRDDIWVCSACGEPVATAIPSGAGRRPAGDAGSAPARTAYGDPASAYGGPAGAYGSPASAYDGPATAYGGPASAYGGPSPAYGGPDGGFAQPAPAYGDVSLGEPLLGGKSSSTKAAERSRLMKIVVLAGLVAVIAIVLVWFFALRGEGGGDPTPYLGSWNLQMPSGMPANGIDSLGVTIVPQGDGAELTLTLQGQALGPYTTTVYDNRLVTTMQAAESASDGQKQAAEMLKNLSGGMIDDFRWVFRPGPTSDTLTMSVEATVQGQEIDSSGQTMTLTKVATP